MAEIINPNLGNYSDDEIKSLKWNEHIRLRPGMYIGKKGDGTSPDDGIYVLIKEVIDNSIDEYMMGYGSSINITLKDRVVSVQDYGRGIPLASLVNAASVMNTGAKYGSDAFTKSVGLNGVGIKAVNALSNEFVIRSVRDGKARKATFQCGELLTDEYQDAVGEKNGTFVSFIADDTVFDSNYAYDNQYIEMLIKNYTYLNCGLPIYFNGIKYISKNGLLDLLNNNITEEPRYEPIHLKGRDIEVVLTHGNGYNESYFSFVNGQYTPQGGTHQAALREAIVKTIKEFYKKDYDPADIRTAIIAAISIRVVEPVFESQTKTKLGSRDMDNNGTTVRGYVIDFIKENLDNYLHKHPLAVEALATRIQESEKERKAISGIRKTARDAAKKVSLHNKKLRDCRVHLNTSAKNAEETMIFITEGDSASGSITKSRNVNTQAVFSLKGKPLNTYGLTKKVIYQNEEFNLLQAALNIEEDLDNLRYNKVIIATDADVDGMHIRLLLITFFLQFFPDIIRRGHLYILVTPLFRVRNKKETIYCYNETEKQQAMETLKNSVEVTRFKGLGEISPDEFRNFINEEMKLEKVRLTKGDPIADILEFYMGKNTGDRQEFIINNLKIEEDIIEEL